MGMDPSNRMHEPIIFVLVDVQQFHVIFLLIEFHLNHMKQLNQGCLYQYQPNFLKEGLKIVMSLNQVFDLIDRGEPGYMEYLKDYRRLY